MAASKTVHELLNPRDDRVACSSVVGGHRRQPIPADDRSESTGHGSNVGIERDDENCGDRIVSREPLRAKRADIKTIRLETGSNSSGNHGIGFGAARDRLRIQPSRERESVEILDRNETLDGSMLTDEHDARGQRDRARVHAVGLETELEAILAKAEEEQEERVWEQEQEQ